MPTEYITLFIFTLNIRPFIYVKIKNKYKYLNSTAEPSLPEIMWTGL